MATAQVSPKTSLSEVEKARRQTNYKLRRPTGYAPSFIAAMADGMRITSPMGWKFMSAVWMKSLGRRVAEGEPWCEVTEPIRTSTLAELCGCDDRTVQREIEVAKRLKSISVRELKKGVYEIQPLFRSWSSLPDYRPSPVEEPGEEPEPEDPAQNDEQKNPKGETRITRKPVYVAAGKASKPVKVDCGVSALQIQAGAIDAKYSAVVRSGVLVVSLEQKWQPAQGVNGLLQTKGMDAKMRQGCRMSPPVLPSNEGNSKEQTKGETSPAVRHPRADELEKLFDPLVQRWCGRAFSNHPASVDLSCNAIADVPHDYLVKLAVDRAGREIKSPKHVVAICRDIARDWEKYKNLPADQKQAPATRMSPKSEAVLHNAKVLRRYRGIA